MEDEKRERVLGLVTDAARCHAERRTWVNIDKVR
jgi:hypothetical protein